MAERLRRPKPGEVWERKSDRGTVPRKVRVVALAPWGFVTWEHVEPVPYQRQRGEALMRTWLSTYTFVAEPSSSDDGHDERCERDAVAVKSQAAPGVWCDCWERKSGGIGEGSDA